MRDIVIGGSGLVLGGVFGAGALLGVQALVAGAVGLTLFLSSPQPVAGVGDGYADVAERTVRPAAKAHMGQVHVITVAAVNVQIDGRPCVFTTEGFLMDVAPGKHRLEVVDMLGRRKVDTEITVLDNVRHSFRWRSKSLEDMGQHALLSAAPAAVAAADAELDAAGQQAVLEMTQDVLDMARENQSMAIEARRQGVETSSSSEQMELNVGGASIPIPKINLGGRKSRGRM